jgi:hypothetical protein
LILTTVPQGIPDRHSWDLFFGGRVEGFERQSTFRSGDRWTLDKSDWIWQDEDV